jgi:hypothetical protein
MLTKGQVADLVLGVVLGIGIVLGIGALVNMFVPLRTLDDAWAGAFAFGVLGLSAAGVRVGTALVRAIRLYARTRYLLRRRRFDELLPVAEELLADAEFAFGHTHKLTTARRHGLCALLWQLGRFHDARVLADLNLGYREEKLGPDHPDTAVSRQLAEMFRAAGAP